ncbi:MAG: hypothetical protein ACLQSR_10985, partial [Limisphaerales bacterium]
MRFGIVRLLPLGVSNREPKMIRTKWLSRIGRMGLALYLIAVIGLVQALFSIFSYVAMPGHPELVPLFRSLSVVFLLVGLLVLGWQCIEPTASIIAQFFMVACIAFSSAEIIFALKGFFMMMIMSRLSP